MAWTRDWQDAASPTACVAFHRNAQVACIYTAGFIPGGVIQTSSQHTHQSPSLDRPPSLLPCDSP
eukprot:2401338-Rhodomonas_salina.1